MKKNGWERCFPAIYNFHVEDKFRLCCANQLTGMAPLSPSKQVISRETAIGPGFSMVFTAVAQPPLLFVDNGEIQRSVQINRRVTKQ